MFTKFSFPRNNIKSKFLHRYFSYNIDFVIYFFISLLFITLIGCKIPRVPIKQTGRLIETYSRNNHKVKRYSIDIYKPDSLNKILKYEYLAKDIFLIENQNDTNKTVLVCAWQEYLWRLSEKLDEVDKPYYTPILGGIVSNNDSITIHWNYPNLDDRDKDMKYASKRRNNYWSVDFFNIGKQIKELYSTTQLSYPVDNTYNTLNRFNTDGAYLFSLRDTTIVHSQVSKIIDSLTSTQNNKILPQPKK